MAFTDATMLTGGSLTETEYRAVLHDTLKRQTESALDLIFQIKITLPEKAEAVEFGIHPSQDFIEGELQPTVPVFGPGDVLFSVNDVIVEVGVDWINTLWSLSGGLGIPGYAFGEKCSTTGLVPLGK